MLLFEGIGEEFAKKIDANYIKKADESASEMSDEEEEKPEIVV